MPSRATTTLARRADELGFHRFWVAEHHNMPTVASTAPAVLIAHLAAATRSIRVGSGGVMLAESRPARDRRTVRAPRGAASRSHRPRHRSSTRHRSRRRPSALRRSAHIESVDDFPRDLVDLMGLLGDVRREHGMWRHFSATPRRQVDPDDRAARIERLQRAARRDARAPVRVRSSLRHRRHARCPRSVPRALPPVRRLATPARHRHGRSAGGRHRRRGDPPRRTRPPRSATASGRDGSCRCCRPTMPRRIRAATTRGGCRRARSWVRSPP